MAQTCIEFNHIFCFCKRRIFYYPCKTNKQREKIIPQRLILHSFLLVFLLPTLFERAYKTLSHFPITIKLHCNKLGIGISIFRALYFSTDPISLLIQTNKQHTEKKAVFVISSRERSVGGEIANSFQFCFSPTQKKEKE